MVTKILFIYNFSLSLQSYHINDVIELGSYTFELIKNE